MIRTGLLWSGIILLTMIAASVYGWNELPEGAQFPVHWDTEGTPNRFAGKLETLWAIPLLTAFLILVFTLAPLFEKRRENLMQSSALYLTGWIGGIGLMGLGHLITITAAIKGDAPPVKLLFVVIALFLIAAGNFMAKSRRNRIAGIKTPWTLKSDHAWSVANRLAGWGFVLTGLFSALSALVLPSKTALYIMLAGVSASVLVSVVMSYFAWRDDPMRDGSNG